MPKYKVDFKVVCIQGNKVKVKDNNGKLTWYHISNIKKTDMITKLICQLPDVDAFGRKGRLSFDPENVKDLGWIPNDYTHKFNPVHVVIHWHLCTLHLSVLLWLVIVSSSVIVPICMC